MKDVNIFNKSRHPSYDHESTLHFFTMFGYRIQTEVKTNKGRMDAVIQTKTRIDIFEFKLDKTANEAIKQIKKREYYQKYFLDEKKLVLIGVEFKGKTGEIKNWEVEFFSLSS